MPIPFTCPSCGRSGRLPDAFTGDKVKCPACQTIATVSQPEREVKPPSPSPAEPPKPRKTPPAQAAPSPQVATRGASAQPMGLYIGGGVGAGVVVLGLGLALMLRGGKGGEDPAGKPPVVAAAPADPGADVEAPPVPAPRAKVNGVVNTSVTRVAGAKADDSRPSLTTTADASTVANPSPASALPQSDEDKAETVRRIKEGTVFLKVRAGNIQASGSGFVIRDEGNGTLLVATNHHVVTPHMEGPEDVDNPQKSRITPTVTAVFRSGSAASLEQSVPAQVIASDREGNRDLAILRVRGVKSPPRPIEITRRSEPFETMPVLIYGFPFGDINRMLDGSSHGNPAITINKGSVSSLRRDQFGQVAHVQIDGSINPGNSGGPVVDESGRLVGVSVAQIRNTTIGFAVPPAELTRMLDGRIGRVSLALQSENGGMADLRIEARLIDPLGKIRSVSLLVGPSSGSQIITNPGDGMFSPMPDATRVNLKVNGPSASGLVKFNVSGSPGRQVLVQTAYQDGVGRTLYTRPEPFNVPDKPSAMVAVGAPKGPGSRPGAKPAFATLGPLIDPGKDCKAERSESKITLDLPAGVHLLSDDFDIKNSPMFLTDVSGDFIATVKVSGAMLPGSDPVKLKNKTLPFTFQGAGLVLWQDKENYLRLERTAKSTNGRVTLQAEVLVEVCKGGKTAYHSYVSCPAGALFLVVARIDGNISFMFSSDGKNLRRHPPLPFNFPSRVQIGLTASNASKEPLTAKFEEFVLVTEKQALEEANRP
jgi:S1-C subfamily serine protease/regulation of enolase protein 1 (concanavalin A-like superfamily)